MLGIAPLEDRNMHVPPDCSATGQQQTKTELTLTPFRVIHTCAKMCVWLGKGGEYSECPGTGQMIAEIMEI
jgi:hypothetical protein